MLVLTIDYDDEILIGDDIRVCLTQIRASAGKVRIGITAPRNVPVDRASMRAAKVEARLDKAGG